jgi:hypothetical protein
MIRIVWNILKRPQRAAGLAFVALMAAVPAQAQDVGSFTVKISEKEMILDEPNDMAVQKYVMWDLGFQRMNDRNMPYIELANAPTSAPITQFRLTIGDERFNFTNSFMGDYAMLGGTTPGFDISSSTVGNLGDELLVNIGDGGLAPGEVLRFKIDLNVDDQFAGQFFQHPDYRTVLFDMNGFNVYDSLQQFSTTDNAQAKVEFDPATGPNVISDPIVFQDELVVGPESQFYNDNYRRYNEMDPVRIFQLGGEAVIPEPSSIVLGFVGALAGLWLSRRSRRPVA